MHAPTEFTGTFSQEPLKLSGSLDQFKSFDVTPSIGTEFKDVDLAEWIKSKNSDAILRDLAILIAQRGVVFFRAQTNMDPELQKEMTQRLGLLSGKPEQNGLHKHPMHLIRGDDPEANKLDTKVLNATHRADAPTIRQSHAHEWHSDMSFEERPPDFSCLRMTEVAETGGDTLWASTYDLYDRFSTPWQKFLESLTVTHGSPGLNNLAKKTAEEGKAEVYKGARGAPENTSTEFMGRQPMVRTHPTTGWKVLWGFGFHVRHIDDVTEFESQELLAKITRLVSDNHDLQVRFRWSNSGDMAIWDNRCTAHCPTTDLVDGRGTRMGLRTISIAGEAFLDPNSKSRLQSKLAEKAKANGETNGNTNGVNGVH